MLTKNIAEHILVFCAKCVAQVGVQRSSAHSLTNLLAAPCNKSLKICYSGRSDVLNAHFHIHSHTELNSIKLKIQETQATFYDYLIAGQQKFQLRKP